MTSLQITNNEYSNLEKLWKQFKSDPNVFELECRFTETITRDVFINLLSRLKALSDYSEIQTDEYTNVTYHHNEKQLHIRHTIQMDEMSNYCNRIFSYVTYDKVFKYPVYINEKSQHFTSRDIPVRFNLKYEVPWSKASNEFIRSDLIDPNTTRLMEKESKLILNDQLKTYRVIKRFSFTTKDELFRIDCSMVKNTNSPTKHITFGNLGEVIPHYEIEIEWLNATVENDFEEIKHQFFKHVYVILQCIQSSMFVMPTSEKKKVKEEYINWINSIRDKIITANNIKTTENFISGNATFISPKPVSMLHSHLQPRNKINIISNYTVTDKADGVSYLLYVSSNGRLYLIDNLINMKFLGVTNTEYSNSLFNGELISKTKDGLTCCDYMMYDAYVIKNENVMNLPLHSLNDTVKTRIQLCNEFEMSTLSHTQTISVRIITKTFHEATPQKNIFEMAKEIWNKKDSYRYKLDGLIFTPSNKPVAFSERKRDYMIHTNRTWEYNIKWKPSEENTIDFLISMDTEVKNDMHGSYRNVHLLVGDYKDKIYDVSKFDWTDDGKKYNVVRWYTVSPTSSVCIARNKEELVNDTIIECSYDFTKPVGSRWIPERTRHDKTNSYKNCRHTQRIQYEVFNRLLQGKNRKEDSLSLSMLKRQFSKRGWLKQREKLNTTTAKRMSHHIRNAYDIPYNIQSGNNIKVARSIWKLIQNPVTEAQLVGSKYYTSNKTASNMEMYRKYHNQIKFALYQITNPKGRPKLLFDIGSGQGGDLNKWMALKFGLVVGVDKNAENIQRALTRLKRSRNVAKNKINFFVGDMSAPMLSNAAFERNERDRLTSLQNSNRFIKYDVVSCQFAVHYFFKNTSTWSGFLSNLLQLLAPSGGMFITTCMNGQILDNRFKTGDGIIEGTFGSLTKKYESDSFVDDAIPLGYTILTSIRSIGTSHEEYLVHPEWFIRQLQLHNIEVVKPDSHKFFKNGAGTFEEIYRGVRKMNSKLKLSEEDKSFSFLNQYFIFKRGNDESKFKHAKSLWGENTNVLTLANVTDYFYKKGYIMDTQFCEEFLNVLQEEHAEKTRDDEGKFGDREDNENRGDNDGDGESSPQTKAVKLRSIHSYKLGELQEMASSLNISTKKMGKKNKEISRSKKELYKDIKLSPSYSKDEKVLYMKGGGCQEAVIMDVHSDSPNSPYYTIQILNEDNRQPQIIQTIEDYLSKR